MNFDTIYADITSKVLPKVAEGFQITKEYAFDLFGRYINFLIVTDSIMLLVNIVLFTLAIYFWIKVFKYSMSEETISASDGASFLLNIIPIIFGIVTFCNIYGYTIDLSKDIFVPEIRIYEIYKDTNNK